MEERDVDWRLVTLGIAHELRSSLQIITTSAFTPNRADPTLARIEKHAHRAQRILEDLLAMATTAELVRERCVLGDVQSLARQDLTAATIRWVDNTESHAIQVHAGLFARVLHSLYENASQANPGGVTITTAVTTAVDGPSRITVSDDGIGVPEGLRDSLFHAGVTGRTGGTGVGLALARHICRVHGGSLTLVPPATFVIELG